MGWNVQVEVQSYQIRLKQLPNARGVPDTLFSQGPGMVARSTNAPSHLPSVSPQVSVSETGVPFKKAARIRKRKWASRLKLKPRVTIRFPKKTTGAGVSKAPGVETRRSYQTQLRENSEIKRYQMPIHPEAQGAVARRLNDPIHLSLLKRVFRRSVAR